LVSSDGSICDAPTLRGTNYISLMALWHIVFRCRQQIELKLNGRQPTRIEQYSSHVALNIILFPLLFFFSGLYYTDVVSTTAVLFAFLNHLERVEQPTNSIWNDIYTVLLGVLALCMRQTNVFWVVVFMGGLEAVHAIKNIRPKPNPNMSSPTTWNQARHFTLSYAAGEIHDLPLYQAWPDDVLFTTISLGIAALCNPVRVLRQIWPYITILAAFAGFVVWNGGVVLGMCLGAMNPREHELMTAGDKSNHVATIHLAQMLYIWPLFAFFSLPLILPSLLPSIGFIRTFLPILKLFGMMASKTPKTPDARISPNLRTKLWIWLLYTVATILASFAIVRYNTIIHPFTLADNRHYMFYVFRYTIRRADWIKYALVLPYTVSRWMVWATLAGCLGGVYGILGQRSCLIHAAHPPFDNNPICPATPSPVQGPKEKGVSQEGSTSSEESLLMYTQSLSEQPVSTSSALVFLLATSLSLITAPLVEPRYFIIPWVMWRLHVPTSRPHQHSPKEKETICGAFLGSVPHISMRHILILETAWFMLINVVTGYIFLAKPFQWRAPDGSLLDEGRWQRFMW
jgi:alpha-1,2-glucosyltransferase